jgi:transcriptional regulator with XRE-family HTH domain
MIRVADPALLGPALAQIRNLLGISRYALARQIAEAKGRSLQACINQLAEWDHGVNSPNVKSLGPVLDALGYDLALVPRAGALTPDRRTA